MDSATSYTHMPEAEIALRKVLNQEAGGSGHSFGNKQTRTVIYQHPVPIMNLEVVHEGVYFWKC